MKPVSDEFKQEIKKYGRQIDTIIKYTDNNGEHLLDSDVLYSVTPNVNGNILKSAMKQLDFESSVKLEKGVIINAQLGLKINEEYEYINFGDYIVSKEPEYNADTQTYSHICYDKMLYSMKEYQKLNIVYPITIREYINTLCTSIGLTFKNNSDTFANYDKQIKLDLYDGLGYTYRDILDELAEVTASTICINETTGELEIRYLNNTQETINEDYLNDINVEFGEKYGPINSIVLSRAAESDNIFLRNETCVQLNGLCELKIIDNQIMNDNDRNIFLADILEKLDGTTYCINDFNSKGILWLDLCDKYTVQIGDSEYQCVLLNDEIKITQGLEESIHTELPTSSETDYTKADETDRRINQTYIMVDKQNQKIESVVSNVTEQNQKISQVEQTVDNISQKVESVADLTSKASGNSIVTLESCMEGPLLELHIYGNNTVFDYLYPADDLYPSDDLYPYGDSRIEVHGFNGVSEESTFYDVYELGVTEVLRQNEEAYDEYVLKDGRAQVIRRVNPDGTTRAEELIEDLGEFSIPLKDVKNIIQIKNYTARIEVKYAVRSTYTDIFATKVEMDSSITQTAEEINLEVRKKVDENEIISKINQTAEAITIDANRININGTVSANGNFKVDTAGNMTCSNAKITGGKIDLSDTQGDPILSIKSQNGYYSGYISSNGANFYGEEPDTNGYVSIDCGAVGPGGSIYLAPSSLEWQSNSTTITNGEIDTLTVNQRSLESIKKNINKFEKSAIEIIKNSDIYEYNFKNEKDEDKKHIGFVIADNGGNYKTPSEVLSNNEDAIDAYNMRSIMWKAIQEQQEVIEQLQKEIKELKEGK